MRLGGVARPPRRSRLTSHLGGFGALRRLRLGSQTYPMDYRGIRYTIRAGIVPRQWSVAIHPPGVDVAARVVNGPRSTAEELARSMIDRWLKAHPKQGSPQSK